MPQAAEDLVEDLIFEYLDEQDWLTQMQYRVLQRAEAVQFSPKKSPVYTVPQVQARRRMALLQQKTLAYYRTHFDEVYLAGARTVNPLAIIGPEERRQIALLNTNEYSKLKQLTTGVAQDTTRFMDMVRDDTAKRRAQLGTTHMKVTPQFSRVFGYYRDHDEATVRLRGIRGSVVGRKWQLGHYGPMVVRTNANRAYNMGTIHAAQKKGAKYLYVMDGPECGWESHHDTDHANGSVRTVAECAAFPIAHPNCKRSFRPATPAEEKKEDARRGGLAQEHVNALKKAAIIGGAATVGLLGAAEATNLTAAGLSRLAQSDLLSKLIVDFQQRALSGDSVSRFLENRLEVFRNVFLPSDLEDATILRASGTHDFPLTTRAKFFGQDSLYPGAPALPNLSPIETVRIFADGFIEGSGLDQIPAHIKTALGALEDATVDQMNTKFKIAYYTAKRKLMAEDNADNVRSLIDYEARRRGLFNVVLDQFPGTSQIRGAWTRYGPRLRIDLTDFFRFKFTKTPTGAIQTLAVNAKGAVRSTIKMYQDGTVGGHLSVIPKNFAKGIIRAIVEVDENGHVVGNLRLVPGGPLRVRLEFRAAEHELLDESGEVVGSIRRAIDLRDATTSVLGTVGNVAEELRRFEFQRMVIELRVFNQSVFDISANLRLPVKEVSQKVEELILEKQMHLGIPDGTFSGKFTWVVNNLDSVPEIFKVAKSTVFGNIRFSSLTDAAIEGNPFLRTLRYGNVRILNAARINSGKLQEIATNMRLYGWNVYDISNVLKITAQNAKDLIIGGMYRVKPFFDRLGLYAWEDLNGAWAARVGEAQQMLVQNGRTVNRAETLKMGLQAMYSESKFALSDGDRVLMRLADIDYNEPYQQTLYKLRSTIEFMRISEVGSDDVSSILDGLTDDLIKSKARRFSETPHLRPVGAHSRILPPLHSFQDFPIKGDGFEILTPTERFDAVLAQKAEQIISEGAGNYTPTEIEELRAAARRGVYRRELFAPSDAEMDELLNSMDFPETGVNGTKNIVVEYGPHPQAFYADEVLSNEFVVEPHFLSIMDIPRELMRDALGQMRFMRYRYMDAPEARFLFGENPMNSPFYENGRVHMPIVELPTERFVSVQEATFWPDIGDEIHDLRLRHQEVSGRINYTFIHELSHHITMEALQRNPQQIVDFLFRDLPYKFGKGQYVPPFRQFNPNEIVGLLDAPLDQRMEVTSPLFQQIRRELGTYAQQDSFELMAEALRHYLTDINPGPVAKLIGEYFDEFWHANPQAARDLLTHLGIEEA